MQNQQFGASLANQIGQQGFGAIQDGANMLQSGIAQQRDMGEFGRAYEQALLNEQYRQQMAPYGGLEFYRNLVGDPTKLSEGKSRSSGFNLSVGGE